MPITSSHRPSADDLLVLLAVGRTGRYTTAAEELGLNHTTISRRIAALEQSTDGFSAYIVAPAAAWVQRDHPGVAVEIVATTRRASQQRSGLDIEVVVGEPQVHRAEAIRLGDYCLGLYGSRDYLAEHGVPSDVDDLDRYPLVYFIDSMLQVDDLDSATGFAPPMRESVTSTNVFVHLEATRAAAGLGLLPCFVADRHDDLVRVLPRAVSVRLTYWLVTRAETLRRPEVAAVVEAIRDRVDGQRAVLLGTP